MIDLTLQKLHESIAKAHGENALQKALSTASNITAYDLQAEAKNLYPVITLLRNRIPRVGGKGGTATHWKSIFGITGSGVSSMPWVPEGQRSGRQDYTAIDKAATYRTLGEEDSITEEAINAAVGFEDAMATMTLRLLQGAMIKEEYAILAGNNSFALATPGTIVTNNPTVSGATLAADTYTVEVVALTAEGWLATGSINGAAGSAKVQQVVHVTGADGDGYDLNGGSSALSASQSQAITLGKALDLYVPAVKGAIAYGWYIGGIGQTPRLEYITTVNSLRVTTPLAGTGQLDSAITGDCSRNANYAFDGLLYSAFASGSNAYLNTLATGTPGTGTTLTTGGRGNVKELDAMLKSMWDNYRVAPTLLLVNSQEQKTITDLVLGTGSSALLRINQEANGKQPYGIVGNGVVEAYYNPYALDGGIKIPVMLHPFVAPGTILAWCENLPAQYVNNNAPNVAEMHIRKDYVQTFWPPIRRKREVGVYVEETLAVYAPFAMGIINNISPN